MLIMATITYPTTSTMEMGKAAVETLKKEMAHVKRVSVHVTYAGEGLTAYNLYELEKGAEDEGSKELVQNFVPYYSIDGFKVKMELVLPLDQALPMIGLSL